MTQIQFRKVLIRFDTLFRHLNDFANDDGLGVMALLRPLLLDNVPSIQQSAALALGRLANYSDELAEAVVSNEILPQLVYSLSEQNVSPWKTVTKFEFLEILQKSRRLRAPQCRQALQELGQGRR